MNCDPDQSGLPVGQSRHIPSVCGEMAEWVKIGPAVSDGCFAKCGSATQTPVSTAPTTNLCTDGSTPTVTEVNGKRSWSCGAAACEVEKKAIAAPVSSCPAPTNTSLVDLSTIPANASIPSHANSVPSHASNAPTESILETTPDAACLQSLSDSGWTSINS